MDVYGSLDMRGKFWIQRASKITDLLWTTSAVSRLVYAKETDGLWYGGETEWRQLTQASDIMNDGQRMIFMTYPLPANWTLETSSINDKAILITNSKSQIGDTGGSWTISGMNTQDTRHNHFAPDGLGLPSATRLAGVAYQLPWFSITLHTHKHNISQDILHTHTFDGAWRPAYTKAIVGHYNV